MRTLVLGPGAIGCTIAARLSLAGIETSAFSRARAEKSPVVNFQALFVKGSDRFRREHGVLVAAVESMLR